MSAQTEEDDLDSLLDEVTAPVPKKGAKPLKRSRKQVEARREAESLAAATAAKQSAAQRLAQIVNLHISGMSYAQIGLAIGASEAEVERMLDEATNRYIRTQPALRVHVRNYISAKFTEMLEADKAAFDPKHKAKLEHQDRVIRILDRLAKLHGADAPSQTEIKVEAAPESVAQMVEALSRAQGMGYDTDIFDTVPGTVVHDAAVDSVRALEVSGNQLGESDGHDDL